MHKSIQQRGFTLVELSIVLVILGLLVGGVLTGQSLIRAAELRSMTSQYQRYQAAVMTFRDKYFALPGDMTNATAYWGIAAGSTGNDSTCKAASSSTAATCNGNGDSFVNSSTGADERFRFWQHLANAGLIEGNYTGITAGSVSGSTTANVPSGRISASLWFVNYWGTTSGDSSFFDANIGNGMEFGSVFANNDPYLAVFKPEDAYNIDTKLDDGKPGTGKVLARDVSGFSGTNCTTATASSQTSATYYLTNTAIRCTMIFPQAF